MKKILLIVSILITTVTFAQDTLTTVSGQVRVGEYVESADRHIVFHIEGQETSSLINKNSISKVKLKNNLILYDSSNLENLDTLPETPEKTLEERQVNAIEDIAFIFKINFCLTIVSLILTIIAVT